MIKFKKIYLLLISLGIFCCANSAFATTPSVSVAADSNNTSVATLTVYGDANSSVIMYYYSSSASGPQVKYLGNTNSSGYYSLSMTLSDYNITKSSALYVSVNGQQSSSITWPYDSTITSSDAITLSQSSLVTKVGQSSTITTSVTNGSYAIYLASNTNPKVANFSINGNQITIYGLTTGQTSANFCLVNGTSNTNCATLYVVVQTSSSQTLSFSQNNTSIISGQNISITISGGNGFYQIQNNSNSNLISANLNGPTLTLYANGTTGSTTIAICSTDMLACGTVNASIGTYTSTGTGLSLSTAYPTITTGQTQSVTISGGYGNYYISSNSNTNVIQTYLSTSTITLYGNTPGTATIIVCSPSGQCGTINATVASSYGGALTLSQSSLTLSGGQIISVTITGGTSPYSIIQNNDGKAQYSLNGNVVTVTGVASGSSSASICSSGGACVTLTVTVSSTSSTISGVQPVFSQNNFSMNTNQTTAISLSGNGGYYVASVSNSNIISATISGSTVVISGITSGSANAMICQTGGQCNTLYVIVSDSSASTVTSIPITFDKTSIAVTVGGATSANIAGGSGTGYYVSYNSNSNAVGAYISGNMLAITGKASGSGTLSVCSSSNICGTIAVTVSSVSSSSSSNTTTTTKYVFTKALKYGMSGTEVTKLQEKLTSLGVYSGPITGYYGSLTVTAVKKLQKLNKLDQLGSVGPGTRAVLNK